MSEETIDRHRLARLALSRVVMMFVLLGALFFGAAGTLAYWEAWLYLLALLTPVILVGSYLYRCDPELLARRMRTREREMQQRRIITLSALWFLLTDRKSVV